MRYIGIFHSHFVNSLGFDQVDLEATTMEEAQKEGKLICYDKDTNFNNCAFTVVEISDHERLVKRNIFGRAFITELPEDDNTEA